MNEKSWELSASAALDGELDPASQIEFERHLEACSGCQEHLSFERSFRQQTRDTLGGTRAPEHLWGRALHRLDEAHHRQALHREQAVQALLGEQRTADTLDHQLRTALAQ